jgi:lysophospholipase L1-like esterase
MMRAGMRRRLAVLLLVGAATAVLGGCASSAVPAPSAARLSVVILGDSLSVDPPHNCEGCTSYVIEYARALTEATGSKVALRDDAVDNAQLADLTDRIALSDVVADLATADVVVVWIGANEGPPWNFDTPCGTAPGDTAEEQTAVVEAYTADCIAATMSLYQQRYSSLFAKITALSPKATSRLALTTVNNWAGNPAFDGSAFPATRMAPVLERVVGIFDAWNVAQCAAAAASGFICVDSYHALNGADGRTALGDRVSDDYTHLSQKGHDEVAELLTEAG